MMVAFRFYKRMWRPAPLAQRRIVRSRLPEAFTEGVETHEIAGHPVRITGIDRTIVDCFKNRNLVTMEVCLEALRERLRHRQHSLQDLNRYARLMRVSRVMQPYLEALACHLRPSWL
jgi:predicted transcriptional regulator of viral defense system